MTGESWFSVFEVDKEYGGVKSMMVNASKGATST
jgi:hypothetical protein